MKRYGIALAVFLFASSLFAQEPATGFPPHGSFEDGRFDAVNRQNLNVNFAIPVVASPGRGLDLAHSIIYDSLTWKKSGNVWTRVVDQMGAFSWGWKKEAVGGAIHYKKVTAKCFANGPAETVWRFYDFAYVDPSGTRHPFGIDVHSAPTSCGFPTDPIEGDSTNGSGYQIEVENIPQWPSIAPISVTVWSREGIRITSNGTMTDPNGNYTGPVTGGWKDTVGRIALIIDSSVSPYIDYKYLDSTGTYQVIQLTLSTFSIKTNFGCSGVTEFTGSGAVPTAISLPNGRSYTIEYEDTPGFPGYKTGRVSKVTLPTGGFYQYSYPAPNNGINCTDGTVNKLTRVINDGVSSATCQFVRNEINANTWKTLVTYPLLPYDTAANQSTYTFTDGRETSQRHYQGGETGGTLLRTTNTAYATNGSPSSTTVILENNQQSKAETVFSDIGNLTELREYDWGAGAPGPVLRTATLTYGGANRIRDRVTERVVRQGGPTGPIKSRTVISYDGSTPTCVTGAPQHDDTTFGCSFNFRGNATKIENYADATTHLDTEMTYDTLGNLLSVKDPKLNTTNFSYADNYLDGIDRGSRAYLTTITKPVPFSSQTVSLKYNYHTGQQVWTTDENSRTIKSTFAEPMRRLTKIEYPDTGEVNLSYNDVGRTVTATRKRTSTENISVTEAYNQLGLLAQTQLPGGRKLDITYDPVGRQWKTSNPYIDPAEATAGTTETRFDALGRVKTMINQDSSSAQIDYAGNATRATDEAGKQRLAETDALGRLVKLCEVTAGNSRSPAQSCGITSYGGTGYLTTHAYDVLDSLTSSVSGSQTRTSAYDFLGRVTSGRILEVSHSTDVTFNYDNNGNLLSYTDPRGTVNLEYDELNRLKRKKHDTTVVASYSYDGTQANNAIGRLITERDGDFGSGADETNYTYDVVGRQLTANRTISASTYAMAYVYDLMGNVTRISYPSASGTRRLVEYSFNPSGEPTKVSDITGTPFDYVTNTTYSPLGTPSQVDLVNSVRTTLAWNKRALVTSILTQKVGGATYLNLGYSYNNNGQIWQITDNLDGNKSEKYTYDELQRLLTAQRGPDASIQRKYSYDYDRYGNRWAQTVVAGSGYGSALSSDTVNNNNRINTPSFGYDTSGNLTANAPGASFSYNQENFLTASGSVSYTRDAQGRRVRKTLGSTTTDYFYVGSEVIAEKQGATWTDYVFFGGERIVKQTGPTASAATHLHTDHLGSTRRCTDSNGNSTGTCDYEPFGEIQPGTTCSVPTNFRFAGMEWDSDAQLYQTWFRQYDPNQGRWLGVDPLAGSSDDPQSVHRYAYVRSDPVNLVDPAGLGFCFGYHVYAIYGFYDADEGFREEYRIYLGFLPKYCWGDDGGGGEDPLGKRFSECMAKHGDKYAKKSLTLQSYLSAQNAASQARIDTSALLAIWHNESKLDPEFRKPGPAGEIGPIQIRPGAARDLKEKGLLPAQYKSDLTANLTAGAHYYAQLSDRYNIPEVRAAGHYNAGPYGYSKAYQKSFDGLRALFSQFVNCMRQ